MASNTIGGKPMLLSGRTVRSLLLLCLAIVVFYSPILFSSQFSLLTGFDPAAMDYPWYNYLASSLKQGHVPLWDPNIQGGRSFVGESATGGFSPLRWAAVLLLSKNGTFSPRSMHIVYVFLHALAAALMFALVRALGLSRFAALFAGLCFSVAGFTGDIVWFDMVESAVWLPLIFLFQLKALQENEPLRRVSYALCAALGIGMTALAGRMHIVILDALFVIAAAVFFAVSIAKDPGESVRCRNRWLSTGLVLAVIGIASFAAAAVQLIPSMEYAREVNRWIGAPMAVPATSKIPYAYLGSGYSPRALFAFLFPFIDVGSGELTPYFGILPFCLALIGAWKSWGNRWARFLTGVAVVSFFYSLGSLSFLHRLAYFFVPYLWFAREPSRFIYLTHFAGVILAGFGADTIFSKAGRHESLVGLMKVLRWCVICSASVVGVLTLLRRPEANDWIVLSLLFLIGDYLLLAAIDRGYRTAGASFLLVALTLCEKGAFNTWNVENVIEVSAHGVNHLERLMSVRPTVSFLKTQPGLFRVHVDADHPPNIGDVYQVQATAGGMSATALKSSDELVNRCGRLDLLNVRYLLRESNAPGQAVYEAGGWKVVEYPAGYPRAWLVHGAVVQPSEEKIFQHVCNRDFDLRQIAILDSPLETGLDGSSAGRDEQAAVRSYEANRMEVETRAERRSLLVLSEMYYPGWIAEVNGAPAGIHKVDGALRGIVVPAGTSRVVLRYAPRTVALGAALTLLAFIGTLLVATATWAKTNTDRHQAAMHEGSQLE
jgi:hypothetical protein